MESINVLQAVPVTSALDLTADELARALYPQAFQRVSADEAQKTLANLQREAQRLAPVNNPHTPHLLARRLEALEHAIAALQEHACKRSCFVVG